MRVGVTIPCPPFRGGTADRTIAPVRSRDPRPRPSVIDRAGQKRWALTQLLRMKLRRLLGRGATDLPSQGR